MMMPGSVMFSTDATAERTRLTAVLGDLCGVPDGMSADRCGRAWCGYFDEERGRCGLLVWDLPMRLGPEALRWFAMHRVTKAEIDRPDAAESFLARTCSF